MAELTRGDLNYLDILTQRGVSQDRQYELLNKARAKKGLQPVQEQSGAASLAYKFTKGLASTGKGVGQLSRLLPGDQKADQNSFYNRYNRDFESVFGDDKLARQKALNPDVSGGGVAEFVGGALPTAVASMGLSAGLNLGLKGLSTVAPKTASVLKPFVSLSAKPSYKDVAKFGAFEGLKDQAIYDVGTTGKTSAGSLAVGTLAGGLLGPAFMGAGRMISKGRQVTGQINKSKAGAYTEPLSNLTNLQRRLDKTYRVDPTKYVEFQKMTGGKTIGQFAAERGVVDTPEEAVIQFTQRGRKSMEEADIGLDAITGNFKNGKLQKALIDLRDEAIAAEDDALGELASNLVRKHDSTGLTMKEINEAKRLYEKNNKFNYLRANDAKAYRRATNLDEAIREFQFKQADLNGFPELRAINKETQANFAAANAIQNKLTKQLGNNEFGLTDWIVASGAMQNPQALGVLLGKKFMSSAEGQKLYNKLLQYFDKTPQVKPPVANVENIGKMQTFKQSFNDGVPRLSPPRSNSQSANRLIPDEVILPTGGTGKPTVKGPYPLSDPTITPRSNVKYPGEGGYTVPKQQPKLLPPPRLPEGTSYPRTDANSQALRDNTITSRSKIVKPGTYTETPVKKEVQVTTKKLRTNEDALRTPKSESAKVGAAIKSTEGYNDFVDYFQKDLGDTITVNGLKKFGFTEKQIMDNTYDFLKNKDNELGVSLEDLFAIAKRKGATPQSKSSLPDLASEARKYKSAKVGEKGKIDTLPSDVSVYDESRLTGAKRISPDRVPHQKLTPEEGIQGIIDDKMKTAKKNYDAFSSILTDIETLKKRYGTKMPTRIQAEKGNFPNIKEDRYKWDYIEKNSSGAKTFDEAMATVSRRAEHWKGNMEKPDFYKESSTNEYIELVKKDISKGYRYPDEVLDYKPDFRKAITARERYEKGLNTSFGVDDPRIVFDEVDKIGAGMKRQDGKIISQEQKQEIIEGVNAFSDSLGLDMKKVAKDDRWVYAHLNGKNPFLMKDVSGLYRPGKDGISISVGGAETFDKLDMYGKPMKDAEGKIIKEKVHTTMAHELGHALDYKVNNKLIDYKTIEDLRFLMNRDTPAFRMNPKYYRKSEEIVARMIEQYVAEAKGHTGIRTQTAQWSKEIFETKVKPAIEKAIDTHYSQYKK